MSIATQIENAISDSIQANQTADIYVVGDKAEVLAAVRRAPITCIAGVETTPRPSGCLIQIAGWTGDKMWTIAVRIK